MKIIPLECNHTQEAASLLLDAYHAEHSVLPILPDIDSPSYFIEKITSLAGNDMGVAAVEDGRLIGFLTGIAVDNIFGSCRGVYIPLYAHATQADNKQSIYQQLYAAASAAWVRDGLTSHVITMYAHDDVALNTWFWQDFGLRCVDAIRPLTPVVARPCDLQIRRIFPQDAESLLALHLEHQRYYRNAPLFMPIKAVITLEQFRDWLAADQQYLWAAFDGDRPVSYMQLRHEGETFVADDEKTMNICGAFTTAGLRSSGAGALILQHIVSWMKENGFERLGVDYESFNIYGSRFWTKHFTAFTYSLTRRIDERIVEFTD